VASMRVTGPSGSATVLVNLAPLIDGENAKRHHNGCLPPGELHSPGHCIHSMDRAELRFVINSTGSDS
jgi:hypothetical protein